ncbi:MAG: helix-turn-helix transcriptional regulator [Clostridia bacterium]|nr:helix-turn-helix transcriptional regulator [Clostridia bacterium]
MQNQLYDNLSYDSERNDFERIEIPPYEKNILGLGGHVNRDAEKDIRVYRADKNTVSHELQIRSDFQIIYPISGSCTISVQGKTTCIPEKGLLLMAQGIPHTITVSNGSKVAEISIPISAMKRNFNKIVDLQSAISSFISNALWGDITSAFMLFHKTNNRYIYSILDMIISEECYPTDNSNTIKTFLIMTLIGYLSSYTPSNFDMSAVRITRSEQIPKILNYINDNYRTVTLEKLAENFHYTVPYVSKLIRNATGMTFTAILRETKFDVCRSLLINSDLKINRIAEIAGFQNTDHFNRIFKKRMGITPSDFKKNKNKTGIDNG